MPSIFADLDASAALAGVSSGQLKRIAPLVGLQLIELGPRKKIMCIREDVLSKVSEIKALVGKHGPRKVPVPPRAPRYAKP